MNDNKEFIDEKVSKRPIPFITNEAIETTDQSLVELRAQIQNLNDVAEALEKDEDWKRVVKDSYRRMEEIAYDTMTLNPSDPNLKEKFSVHWGQWQERKKVTEEVLSVKTLLQTARQREKTLSEKMVSMLKRLTHIGE